MLAKALHSTFSSNGGTALTLTRKIRSEEVASPDASIKTCFVMMPISDVEGYPVGHFSEVYNQLIRPSVEAAGYKCSLATSTSAAHLIQLEVVTRVATADLCICDLSTNNANVLFEYGIRQAFDKPTVLIKDDKTRRIFDVSGFRDIEYDHTLRIANTLAARDEIVKAIADTVNGSSDSEQVFSLVKLMKLTKAALPAGEVTQDDARFVLLEQKLDKLANMISVDRMSIASFPKSVRKPPIPPSPRMKQFADGTTLSFRDDHLVLTLSGSEPVEFHSAPELEKSDFWSRISDQARASINETVLVHSPNFIPF
ncbi:Hypothetical protein NGAL_HAMBI490_60530 [Neorhizobium galegae bv. officinalis]|nr:Hypothetical protein NGAL_HAMBI490_60530 [Neorhizobium galegae bv. officinalis]